MAGNYSVTVDLAQLLAGQVNLAEKLYPLLRQAIEFTAQEGAFRWKSAVKKARLRDVEKNQYIEAIGYRMVDAFNAEIICTYDEADKIENGRPARDLKRALQTSKRVRVATQGKHKGMKYLIIPFRHNIPSPSGEGALAAQMPPAIYAAAKPLAASKITGQTLRLSGQISANNLGRWSKLAANRLARGAGAGGSSYLIPQAKYSWGGRLPAGLATKLKDHHVTDPYAGMVRFDTSTGKSNRSQYLTFRVMGEWSSGWIVPAKPGLSIAKKVSQELQPLLEENVGQAITLGMLRR